MNDQLEQWMSTVASRLDLPAKQKAAVISELRTHLQADFSDRLCAGLSPAEAARETLAQMGGAESVACELNHVYRPEGTLARTFIGVLIMLVGCEGIAMSRGMIYTLRGLADVLGCHDQAREAWHWLTHIPQFGVLLVLLPLAGMAFVVGYIARRRAWRCALLPALGLGFVGLAYPYLEGAQVYWWSALATAAGDWHFYAFALAILSGAHLGARLARSPSPYRRSLVALLAGIASVVPVLSWTAVLLTEPSVTHRSLLGLILLPPILTLTVWALAMVVRRAPRARV